MDVTLWDDIRWRQIDTLVLRYPGRVRRGTASCRVGAGLGMQGFLQSRGTAPQRRCLQETNFDSNMSNGSVIILG